MKVFLIAFMVLLTSHSFGQHHEPHILLSKLIELQNSSDERIESYLKSCKFDARKYNKTDEGEYYYSYDYNSSPNVTLAMILCYYDKDRAFYEIGYRFISKDNYKQYFSELKDLTFKEGDIVHTENGGTSQMFFDSRDLYVVMKEIPYGDHRILYSVEVTHPSYIDKRMFQITNEKNTYSKNIGGTYKIIDGASSAIEDGELVLLPTSEKTFTFSLKVNNGKWYSGSIKGNAKFTGDNNAVFQDNEHGCKLTFNFLTKGIKVKESACFYYHGANIGFTGIYSK